MPVTRPSAADVRIFRTADEFGEWLAEHHDVTTELWVGYYRKGVSRAAMTYAEAVEEALCYGWIDGITYRVSDEVTASRFTPRRKGSAWSRANLARVAELTAAGRMRPPGMRAYEGRDPARDEDEIRRGAPAELPVEAERRFRANPAAWSYWQAERPSYRRNALLWIHYAKRPETRERRLEALIADSAAGRRIKPLSYGR